MHYHLFDDLLDKEEGVIHRNTVFQEAVLGRVEQTGFHLSQIEAWTLATFPPSFVTLDWISPSLSFPSCQVQVVIRLCLSSGFLESKAWDAGLGGGSLRGGSQSEVMGKGRRGVRKVIIRVCDQDLWRRIGNASQIMVHRKGGRHSPHRLKDVPVDWLFCSGVC